MTAALRLPPPADATTLDHDQIVGRLADLLQSLYPWLALSKADLARVQLEAQAHVGDLWIFLLNRTARQSRLLTADQRSTLLGLVKLLGYRPRGATAATAAVTFTLTSPAAALVTIAAGRVVKTEEQVDPVKFQLLADVVIAPGQSTGTGTAENSASATDTYLSTGQPSQAFRLASSPYLDGSAVVSTPAGAWTEVRNFLDSTSIDRHFTTTIDAKDRVTVTFGDGTNGAVPLGLITIAYKTGGGVVGNVSAGALKVTEGSVADVNGVVLAISVTNAADASPGFDRESGAEIQLHAPASIAVPRSAVSRTDYEAIAEQVPGVAYSLMLTRNQTPSVLENEGFLFVVPADGSVAGTPLLTSVAARFGDAVAVGATGVFVQLPAGPTPKTVTFQLRVRAASYKPIDLYAKIFLRRGAVPSVVQAAITRAFTSFFAIQVDGATVGLPGGGLVKNPAINFGFYLQDVDGQPTGHFAYSDLYNAVRDVPGVREIGDGAGDFALNGAAKNVTLALYEFPRPGTIQLVLV